MKDKIYAEIVQYAKEIRMPSTVRCFEDEVRMAEVKINHMLNFFIASCKKNMIKEKKMGRKIELDWLVFQPKSI